VQPNETQEIIDNLVKAGFPAGDIMNVGGVVYVGRDAEVSLAASREMLQAGDSHKEQYRTINLVSNSLAKICVDGSTFTGVFSTALDLAIQNYDELPLTFAMARTPSADCSFTINAAIQAGAPGGVSGFPSGGLPFGTITIFDQLSTFSVDTITHVITHEIGHTIGFRHSDYYDRSISCGTGSNEGDAGTGAILIAGTPSTATIGGSVMNSCFRTVETGQFTSTDFTALLGLYPPLVPPRIGVIAGGHLYVKEGGLSTAWVDEAAGVTAGMLSGNRIGVLAGGHLSVKEGDLNAAWVHQAAGVTDAALSGNRIGVLLSDGHWYVKEGGLSTAWVDEAAGVTAGMLSGNRIGVLTGGHLSVKEGDLYAAWVHQAAGATDAALSGNRIGVLLSDDHWYVKEGGLSTAWVDEAGGVTAGILPTN
jgi:hypothetical protein